MTNIYHDITHVGGNVRHVRVSGGRDCELCGLPMASRRKLYHDDCRIALRALRAWKRAQRLGKSVARCRFDFVVKEIRWLLALPNRELKRAAGETGEAALMAFDQEWRRGVE